MSFNILDGKALSTRYIAADRSGKAISRYWRRLRAEDEATELALVLRALRKVAEHIGSAVRPVYWLGMTPSSGSCIIVDPHEFVGRYPMPPRSVDVLVGLVVKEAYYDLEWSHWVRTKTVDLCSERLRDASDYLIGVLAAGEDIFVDAALPDHSVLSLYLSKYWRHSLSGNDRDPSLPPNPESLADVWRAIVLTGHSPKKLHQGYDRPLQVLLNHTDLLRDLRLLATVSERRVARVDLYERLWTCLSPHLSRIEGDETPPRGVLIRESGAPRKAPPEKERPKKEESEDRADVQEPSKGLEREVGEEVASILDNDRPDVDNWVRTVVKDEDEKVMPTAVSAGSALCSVKPDPDLVHRLKKIFQAQHAGERRFARRRTRRGLTEGKVDSRRLYRWSIDEKIFKMRQKLEPDQQWSISLVVDASASMARKNRGEFPWTATEKTLVSLAEAAKQSRTKLQVYAYYEQGRCCQIVSLLSGDNVFTLCPTGETPSGQALLAAALLSSGKAGKTLILHVTDGGANCGIDVSHATAYCVKNGIDLVTLGCGYTAQTRRMLTEQYENRLRLMEGMYHLPECLEGLIRERLLTDRRTCTS
ncbi:MAG: hypothetical protein RDU20_14090 [Desulfomonilaceae bacterium]|nr:hypothetical protein [Desulfomonilaceae bacterium]